MRGSDLNKAIYTSNHYIKKTLIICTLLYNFMIIVLQFFNNRLDKTKFIISSIPEIIVILCIFKISTPFIRKEDNFEELIDPGTPLSGKGIPSLLFDSLVISMLVKLLIFYSYGWCVLYFVIVWCAFYELVYKTVQKLKTN